MLLNKKILKYNKTSKITKDFGKIKIGKAN